MISNIDEVQTAQFRATNCTVGTVNEHTRIGKVTYKTIFWLKSIEWIVVNQILNDCNINITDPEFLLILKLVHIIIKLFQKT